MYRRSVVLLAFCLAAGICTGTAHADSDLIVTDVYQNPDSTYSVDVLTPTTIQVQPVYRFYSDILQDYFWTVSADEKNQLQAAYQNGSGTYLYQGVYGYVEKSASARTIPVYRFYNKKTGDHFYTMNEAEKNQVEEDYRTGKDNYAYEGIAWYASKSLGKPVYRFFDTVAFDHYYTSNEGIRDSLITQYKNKTGNWRYEGIGWYWYE